MGTSQSSMPVSPSQDGPPIEESPVVGDREVARNAFLKHLETQCSDAPTTSLPVEPPPSQEPTVASAKRSRCADPPRMSASLTESVATSTSSSSVLRPQNHQAKPAEQHMESLLIEALFGCTLGHSELNMMVVSNPSLFEPSRMVFLLQPDLFSEAAEVGASLAPQRLTFAHVEIILEQGVRFFFRHQCDTHLRWLGACFGKCTLSSLQSTFLVHRTWTQYQQSHPSAVSLDELRSLIVNYAILSLRCPEYFIDQALPEGGNGGGWRPTAGVSVYRFLELPAPAPAVQFLSAVFQEFSGPDEAVELQGIVGDLLDTVHQSLLHRNLHDMKLSSVTALQLLYSIKPLTAALTCRTAFLPTSTAPGQRPPGWALHDSYILGPLLRPTPLDDVLFLHDPSSSTRERFFGNILHKPATSTPLLELRRTLKDIIEANTTIVTAMCRGPQRSGVLQWIAGVLAANEPRHRQVAQMQLASLPQATPTLEAFIFRAQGLSCTGFNLNVFWLILKLLEPVKPTKVSSLDPFYMLRDDAAPLLGTFLQEARFGDSDDVSKACEIYRSLPDASSPSKFPTQLLFLALRALHCLYCPSLKEYENLISKVEETSHEIQQRNPSPGVQQRYEVLVGKTLCFHSVLFHPDFMAAWWKFCSLTMTFLSRIMLAYKTDGTLDPAMQSAIESANYNMTTLLHDETPAAGRDGAPPQLHALPLCCFDDMTEAIRLFLSLPPDTTARRGALLPNISESLAYLDAELLAALALFFMRADTMIRNPHSRLSSGSQTLVLLCTHSLLEARLDSNPGVVKWLIPALVGSFIDAQKAGYYGRIQQRLLYARLLERVLPAPHHTQRLKLYASSPEQEEIFVRFLAMLVESMTWLLDEAMSSLAEIKKRETQPGGGRVPVPGAQDSRSSVTGVVAADTSDMDTTFDATATEEGHNVSDIPFEQLERLCQTLMDGGLRSIKVMALIAKICGDLIVGSSLLLPQVVTSLDCCLEHLVGPRCLQLKVSNFEKYNFEPRQLLATICEIYITLEQADAGRDRLYGAICNDTRYFKPGVFMKAHQIARREALMRSSELAKFYDLAKSLQQKASEVEFEEHWLEKIWDDVPDEFKDPIMDDLMTDPVKLPTSGHIMDRKNIERHLMTEEFDPFNRMPLKKADLVPEDELRRRIEAFVSEKRAEAAAERSLVSQSTESRG